MAKEDISPGRSSSWLGSSSLLARASFYLFCLILVLGILAGAYAAYRNLTPATPPYQHTYNACSSSECHARPSSTGKIYVAVDGKDVSDNPLVTVGQGDAFEVDWHFENVVGDPRQYKAVGIQMTLPEGDGWTIGPGTSQHPQEWSASGEGRDYWSPAWDRGDSDRGRELVRWARSNDRKNVYYASFLDTAWSFKDERVAAGDSGDRRDGDLDGKVNHMGIDAMVGVPLKAELGDYEVTVAGVGRDKDGKPASISKVIKVQVRDPLDPALAGKTRRSAAHVDLQNELGFVPFVPPARPTPTSVPTPTAESLASIYARRSLPQPWPTPVKEEEEATRHSSTMNCKTCHDDPDLKKRPIPTALPIDHAGRAESTCRLCHQRPYMPPYQSGGPSNYIVPRIPHSVAGRDDCLSCHQRPGGIKPVSSTHAGRTSQLCRGCHQLPSNAGGPALTPHDTSGRENCLSCHTPPADHGGRKNKECVICHIPSADGPNGLTGYAIPIVHSLRIHADCSRCHVGP
ncbi:MAG: hypothetical protein M1358_14195 [Chloroflexi bacterium]|nr:hypothetical protein [Chloroflexota bacterium]